MDGKVDVDGMVACVCPEGEGSVLWSVCVCVGNGRGERESEHCGNVSWESIVGTYLEKLDSVNYVLIVKMITITITTTTIVPATFNHHH